MKLFVGSKVIETPNKDPSTYRMDPVFAQAVAPFDAHIDALVAEVAQHNREYAEELRRQSLYRTEKSEKIRKQSLIQKLIALMLRK